MTRDSYRRLQGVACGAAIFQLVSAALSGLCAQALREVRAPIRQQVAEEGLALTAHAIRDTVRLGDSVQIVVAVRNSGPAQRFRNDPQSFFVEAFGPDGRRVPRAASSYEPPALGSRVDVVIPRGGAVSQKVNLTCARLSAAWSTGRGRLERCDWQIAFDRPGVYRIGIRYAPVPPPERVRSAGVTSLKARDFTVTVLPPE